MPNYENIRQYPALIAGTDFAQEPQPPVYTSNVATQIPINTPSKPSVAPMSDHTREEIDAKIAASEARGDTKIAQLAGKIDTLAANIGGKLDAISVKISADHEYNRSTRTTIVWSIIASALAIIAIIIAMATYGDALFGRGMNVRDVVQSVVKEQMLLNQLPTQRHHP